MARLRTRIKRTVYLLGALVLLLLLLELNRWMPGTWHGGGGGGFRVAGEMGEPDPLQAAAGVAPADETTDPAVVEAPTVAPTDWPPKEGVVIQMRGPDGAAAKGWRLERDGRGLGFRLHGDGHTLQHRNGLDVKASAYVAHVPAGTPAAQREPGPVEVEVVDPLTGEPVAGAHLTWIRGGKEQRAKTDAQGRASVLGEASGEPFQVTVWSEGRVEREGLWLRPRLGSAAKLTLPEKIHKRLRFRWPDRRPAIIGRALVRGQDGAVLARLTGGGRQPSASLDFPIAADDVAGAVLLVEPTRTDIDGLRISLPLEGLADDVELPNPRTLRIVVRGVDGEPVAGAEVIVRVDLGEAGPGHAVRPWRTRTNIHGEASASLAPGQGCEIVVRKGNLGPAARRLNALDGSDVVELVMVEGVSVAVRAPAPHGGVSQGVQLLARGNANGVQVTDGSRQQMSGPMLRDMARIGPLPTGPIELFARSMRSFGGTGGSAWKAAVLDARPAMGTVDLTLERGYPISFVVEDAFGVPLEDAAIELSVTSGGEPHVVPPNSPPGRTNAKGRLTLRDLPNRVYEVRISRRGYGTQRLRGIRPGGELHFITLLRQP